MFKLPINTVAVFSFTLLAFSSLCATIGEASSSDRAQFIKAIEDASVPQDFEVYNNLVAVSDNDPRITWRDAGKKELLVVTWKSEQSFKDYFGPAGFKGKTSDNSNYATWVTTAPQVKKFCRGLKLKDPALSSRLKQYLGLDPDRPYDRFVEMWVERDALFRPCPDPETNDSVCNLTMEDSPTVRGISDYQSFFLGLYGYAYSVQGAPWTRLGYTYDWGGGEHEVGASEFILSPGAAYEVRSAMKTADYCKP